MPRNLPQVRSEFRNRFGSVFNLCSSLGALCLAPLRKLAAMPERRQPTLTEYLRGKAKPDVLF